MVPRIRAISDIVLHINVNSILDVASQRGALLFPLLHRLERSHVPYNLTSIDINPEVVDFLQSTSGDFDNFRVVQADITNLRKYNL